MKPFRTVQFDKENHIYRIAGKKLLSTTQFLSRFKPEINWNEIAENMDGNTDEILEQWKENSEQALEKGNSVHLYIQKRLEGMPYQIKTIWHDEYTAFEDFWNRHKKHLKVQFVEWVIGDEELGIGGTIDVFVFDEKLEKYRILDWKTGRRFRIENNFTSLLKPFSNLDNCELVNYSLQLSLYHLILKRNTDFPLASPIIIRLKDDWSIYQTLDFCDKLESILLTVK